MPNESGDLKLLGNFRRLIDLVSADAAYQPSNPALRATALNTLHTEAMDAAVDVSEKRTLNMTAISDREAAFADLQRLFTRVHGVAKASGATPEQIADLETFKRKLVSKRKAKAAARGEGATTPDQTAATPQHSSAQLSYDNMVGHVRGYLSVLDTIAGYSPAEPALTKPALNTFLDDLQAKNDAVSSSFVPLSQARGLRDQLLYQADNSVVNNALLVKEYVKGAFGTQSQLYKQIRPIKMQKRAAR